MLLVGGRCSKDDAKPRLLPSHKSAIGRDDATANRWRRPEPDTDLSRGTRHLPLWERCADRPPAERRDLSSIRRCPGTSWWHQAWVVADCARRPDDHDAAPGRGEHAS